MAAQAETKGTVLVVDDDATVLRIRPRPAQVPDQAIVSRLADLPRCLQAR